VFATKGHALRFAVPPLPPRATPLSPPISAAFESSRPVDNPQSMPISATFGASNGTASTPKPADIGDLRDSKPAGSADVTAPKAPDIGNPMSFKELPSKKPPSGAGDASGGVPVENGPAAPGQDQVLKVFTGKPGKHRAAAADEAETLPLPAIRHARAR